MAEAVVENRPPPVRFFCHKCNIDFVHVLQDYTCPFCAMGFIEKLEENNLEGDRREESIETTLHGRPLHQRAPHSHIHRGEENTDEHMTMLEDTPDEILQETDPSARWHPPWNYRDPNARHSDSPHFVNMNDFAFLLQNAQSSSGLNNSSQGTGTGGQPRESRFLQLVQQVVLGGEGGSPFVVLGGRGMGPGLDGALGGEYVMSGEGLDAFVTQLLWQAESDGPPPLPAQAIASLPDVTISMEQIHQGLQCSICWETFIQDEKVKELSCGHVYHQGCITPWLSLHATCPICRKSLAPSTPSAPPPSGGQPQEQQATPPPNFNNSTAAPSLAFLFRACGIPAPNNISAENSSGTPTTSNESTSNPDSSAAPPPPPPRGSMSELFNQLVSMSGAMALNFTMGNGPPIFTATTAPRNASTTTAPTSSNPSQPPANYDSDMEFD